MAFLAGLTKASGIRVLAGQEGRVYRSTLGEVVLQRAPKIGADRNLFACLKGMADHLGIIIVCSSIDTGIHSEHSRHYRGCAADIDLLGHLNDTPELVCWPDALCDEMVAYLHACGFKPYENGPHPAVLWGAARTSGNQTAVPHLDHCHVSIDPRRSPGSVLTGDVDGEVRDMPSE